MILPLLVVAFGASGTYLLLPHRHGLGRPRTVHLVGLALAGLALVLFACLWTPPRPLTRSVGDALQDAFFYAFALTAVGAAVATVTVRDPIHNALWFAAVVLATSGLYLQAGAQFLAVGTIIVYAGAIIVTFLFVIMLAQMEGRATYDRAARSPFAATLTCYMLFFGLLWSLFHMTAPGAINLIIQDGSTPPVRVALAGSSRLPVAPTARDPRGGGPLAEVLARANRPTGQLNDGEGRPKPHVAGLGETLYTDHVVTVELAGALLFVALIGALAIATPKPPVRPGETRQTADVYASTAEAVKPNA